MCPVLPTSYSISYTQVIYKLSYTGDGTHPEHICANRNRRLSTGCDTRKHVSAGLPSSGPGHHPLDDVFVTRFVWGALRAGSDWGGVRLLCRFPIFITRLCRRGSLELSAGFQAHAWLKPQFPSVCSQCSLPCRGHAGEALRVSCCLSSCP